MITFKGSGTASNPLTDLVLLLRKLVTFLLRMLSLTWLLTSAEEAKGAFATMVVILPSLFTGGAVHLSHGPFSVVHDYSAQSQVETVVLSWYTDVAHKFQPITSGYRLALYYNLVHITPPSVNRTLSTDPALYQ